MIHDFIDGQTVYMMSGKSLFTGIITDSVCFNNDNFLKFPLAERMYIPVKWLGTRKLNIRNLGMPIYLDIYHTKEACVREWYKVEYDKLLKTYKKLMK